MQSENRKFNLKRNIAWGQMFIKTFGTQRGNELHFLLLTKLTKKPFKAGWVKIKQTHKYVN